MMGRTDLSAAFPPFPGAAEGTQARDEADAPASSRCPAPQEEASASEFWEPWQPKVGDRVRVRLSGECQVRFGHALDTRDGPVTTLAPTTPLTHVPEEDGRLGTVEIVFIPGATFRGVRLRKSMSHRFAIRYDEALRGRWALWGSAYAAIELEPLEVPAA